MIETTLGERERVTHELRLRLEALDLGRRLGRFRARLDGSRRTLAAAMREAYRSRQVHLRTAVSRLEALSPLAVLGRGYAVCWTANRTAIIRDAATVTAGQEVRVTLHRGELECEVKKAE